MEKVQKRKCKFDSPTVVHERLGTIFHGIKHPVSNSTHQLEQFRGIKYASIPARFRRSRLVSSYPPDVDATRYGPIAPQAKVRNVESLYGLHPGQYPIESFSQSESECLNLNVTAPAYLSPDSNLPVIVWVHGGGNVGGAGSRWLLDGGHLVRRSMEFDQPIIFVAINYRLGLFGFAASPDILEDNTAAGDKGVGNYGLHDQLNALRWIHRHISAFGGDASRITVCGQGKGAVDVHSLLLAGLGHESNLVYRAILQSGTCPPPSTYPSAGQQGAEFTRVCNLLHVPLGDGALEGLRNVDADDLVKVCTEERIKISPTNDGVFFRPTSASSELDPPAHLGLGIDAILIGDTYTEATPYTKPASRWTPNALTRRLRAVLRDPYKTDAVLRAFEVSEDDERRAGREEFSERVGELVADSLVGYGIERLANRLAAESDGPTRTKVYRYLFDQPSPLNLTAHHTVDLVYLFGNIDFEKCASEPYSIGSSRSSAISDDGDQWDAWDQAGTRVRSSPREEISQAKALGISLSLSTSPNQSQPLNRSPPEPITPHSPQSPSQALDSTSPSQNFPVNSFQPESQATPTTPNHVWNEHDGYQMPHLWVWGSGSNDGWYEEKRVAQTMQRKWIEFVSGKEPWGEYKPVLPNGWGETQSTPEGGRGRNEERETRKSTGMLATPSPSPPMRGMEFPASDGHAHQQATIEQVCDNADGLLHPPNAQNHISKLPHHHHSIPHDPIHLIHLPHSPSDHEAESGTCSCSSASPFSAISALSISPASQTSTLPTTASPGSMKLSPLPVDFVSGPFSPSLPSSTSNDVPKAPVASVDNVPEKKPFGEIYIFGPAGDTYSAPVTQLADHRRLDKWREAFDDWPMPDSSDSSVRDGLAADGEIDYDSIASSGFKFGSSALELREIVRIGMELANGPPEWRRH